MLWSFKKVIFELKSELSERDSHVALSEKLCAKALGQTHACPAMFSGLQEAQSSGVGEPERRGGKRAPAYKILPILVSEPW